MYCFFSILISALKALQTNTFSDTESKTICNVKYVAPCDEPTENYHQICSSALCFSLTAHLLINAALKQY